MVLPNKILYNSVQRFLSYDRIKNRQTDRQTNRQTEITTSYIVNVKTKDKKIFIFQPLIKVQIMKYHILLLIMYDWITPNQYLFIFG